MRDCSAAGPYSREWCSETNASILQHNGAPITSFPDSHPPTTETAIFVKSNMKKWLGLFSLARGILPSANQVTIIPNYFYFHRLYAIISDYLRLFTIFLLQKPERLYAIIALSPKRRLFHLLHYDYFTYFFLHVLLRLLQLYHDYLHYVYRELLFLIYLRCIIAIIFSKANYLHYAHYLTIIRISFLSYHYNDYLFPILLYALLFSQQIMFIGTIMAIKK